MKKASIRNIQLTLTDARLTAKEMRRAGTLTECLRPPVAGGGAEINSGGEQYMAASEKAGMTEQERHDIALILDACPAQIQLLLSVDATAEQRAALDRVVRVLVLRNFNRNLALKYLYAMLDSLGRAPALYETECRDYSDGDGLEYRKTPDCPTMQTVFDDAGAVIPDQVEKLESIANRGDRDARALLGYLVIHGHISTYKEKEGVQLLRNAAARGSQLATEQLTEYHFENARVTPYVNVHYRRALEYATTLGQLNSSAPAHERVAALINSGVYQKRLLKNFIFLAIVLIGSFLLLPFCRPLLGIDLNITAGPLIPILAAAAEILLVVLGAVRIKQHPLNSHAIYMFGMFFVWMAGMLAVIL